MAELDINQSTTTDLKGTVQDYSVNSSTPDENTDNIKETWYDYPDSTVYRGYYKNIPELKKAIDSLATWTTGKGYQADTLTDTEVKQWIGMGEDNVNSILWNLQVQKKVYGDAFAEIIRSEDGRIVNLKPLFVGNMRVVVDAQGLIKRYEHRVGNRQIIKFATSDILHLMNDRIDNEIHGTSVIEACKWIIDARNEALADERKLKHRELSLGVLYVDSDNTAKITKIKEQYAEAVKNGELLVLPKDTAEIRDTGVRPQDRIAWIQYLENFFYQAVGIPRVIATSENFTEASSKVGFLTFEPIYTREQTDLESDLWSQLAIRIKFNRPPSLMDNVQSDEAKNTVQTGFQPNDVQAGVGE